MEICEVPTSYKTYGVCSCVRPLRECLGVVVIGSDTQKFLKLVHHFSWVILQLLSINNHQLQEKIKRETDRKYTVQKIYCKNTEISMGWSRLFTWFGG